MNKNKLKPALKQISDFITKLESSEETPEGMTLGLFFSAKDEGRLSLSGDEAKNYQDGLRALVAVIDSEVISPKAVEKLFQKAILYVLDISEKRRDKTFDQRLNIALANLEKSLSAPLATFGVYYPVGGLSEEGLPVQIGKVTFCTFDNDRLEDFKDMVRKYEGR